MRIRVKHYNVRKFEYPDMTKRYGIVYSKPGRIARNASVYLRNHIWSFLFEDKK